MNLKMNFNNFIKLKDFFNLKDIGAEVVDYSVNEASLEGILFVQGKYLKNDNLDEVTFNNKIPFNIIFSSNDIEVEDINCENIETVEVTGRGLEISFDISVIYYEIEEVPVITEKDEIEVCNISKDEEFSFENIKNDETKRVDELLKSTLSFKDDNHPTEDFVDRNIKDSKTTIKVLYYQNEKELEQYCKTSNLSLNKVYNENKEFDIAKYRRVILNDDSSY